MPQGYVGGTAALEGETRKQCFCSKLFLDDPVSVVNKKSGRRNVEEDRRPAPMKVDMADAFRRISLGTFIMGFKR